MQKLFTTWLSSVSLGTCLLAAGGAQADTISVADDLSGDVTWHATNEYILESLVHVLGNATLNIEAGTVIKALPGQDADTTGLIVTRGAKIFAMGTREQPIIFTAEVDDVNDPTDLGIFQRGLWGGVVIMGNARVNTTVDAAGNAATPKYEVFEGLPDTEVNGQFIHRFGGSDDDDNSGVFRYVSIRHAGVVFAPNRELNGLSLCAVGRGTTIDYVEAYAIADDGFEFFGGTVNTKHLVSTFNDDDCFDTDQGYSGKNQFWFAIQEPGRKDNGGELNGEPNGLAVSNAPFANFEIYNATWIGSGAANTNAGANHAMTIREYAAPRIYNSIFTDFKGEGVRITDGRSLSFLENGLLDIRNNIWGSFSSAVDGTNAAVLFSDSSRRNEVVDPALAGISRDSDGGLDPRPLASSPALIAGRAAPNDGFYEDVGYKGAFSGEDLWLRGWTFLDKRGFLATGAVHALPAAGQSVVEVTDDISGSATWYRTNEYILNTLIHVLPAATLNIEAGTIIKGLPGQDADTTGLIVSRGAKIFARGTPSQPVIFTAEVDDVNDPEDLGIYQRGLWGGVVIMGSARLNTTVDAAGNAATPKYEVFEGLPDTEVGGEFIHRFGGDNDDDDSGVFTYVSIRHGGVVFAPNRELNGLSLCAVGRGTTIDHVEAYAIADDGFEFFGGTVNTKHLVSAFNDDDCFDTDQGYSGKNQFWFAIQEPGRKDNGGELNGEPNGLAVSNAPFANFEIYNATWIGSGAANTNAGANHAMTIREYAAPRIYNSIFTDFKGEGVRITDGRSLSFLENGLLDIRDNIWWNFSSALAGTNAGILFTDPARNNASVDPLLGGISRVSDHQLDPRPLVGSPALLPVTIPSDAFYSAANYKGAFNGTDLWLTGWTFLDKRGFLPGGVVIVCEPVDLAISPTDGGFNIQWIGVAGATYQVQSATEVIGPWANEGPQLTGAGPLTYVPANAGGNKFFRVVCQ